MPKIQNSPKSPNTKSKYNKSSSCWSNTKRLDTNSTCVEQISKPTGKLKVLSNRTDFLKDKNTGKPLWTNKEIISYKLTKAINKEIIQKNKSKNINLPLKPLKQPKHTFCGCRVKTDYVSIETKSELNSENQLETKNFITGNAQCKDIWRCPSCSMKLLKGRAKEIYNLADSHQKQGYKLGFVTLTIRHYKENSYKHSLEKLLTNYRKFQSHKLFRNLKKTILLGQVKALETTYTQLNGFHPHLHVLFFYKTDDTNQIKKVQTKLIQDWATYTGGYVKSQDQKIVYNKDGVSKYITKWDAIQELTNDHNKSGKGIKPFQFLTKITKNEHLFENQKGIKNENKISLEQSIKETKILWIKYVETIKGKRRIIISRKLLQTYKLQQKTDEQIVEETEHGTKIISFSKETWNIIYQNNLQPYLLYICDTNKLPDDQQKEILKHLQKYGNVYQDNCEWDHHRPNNETHPIIRLNSEKQNINDWHNFIENSLI